MTDLIPYEEAASPVVKTIIYYNPFDYAEKDEVFLDWDEEKKLSQYLDGLPSDTRWSIAVDNVVCYSDEEIPEIKLSKTSTIILKVVPKAKIAMMVGALVAMVALTVFSGGIAAALFAGLAPEIASALVIGVGSLLISGAMMAANMLMAPKKSKAVTGPAYGLDGPQETSEQGAVVPNVYGEFRVGGNKVATLVENGFNYTDGNNTVYGQWFYALYAVSEGPISGISALEVNKVDATLNYPNIETIYRVGDNSIDGGPIGWFSEVANTVSFNEALTMPGSTSSGDGWIYGTTRESVNRIRFDLEFPNGLYYESSKGKIKHREVDFTIQYRVSGDTEWTTVSDAYGWYQLDAESGNTEKDIINLRITVLVTGDVGVNGQSATSDYNFNVQAQKTKSVAKQEDDDNTNSTITQKTDGDWWTFGSKSGTIINNPIFDSSGNITGYTSGTAQFTFETGSIKNSHYNWKIVNSGTAIAVQSEIDGYYQNQTSFRGKYQMVVRFSVTTADLTYNQYDWRISRTTHASTDVKTVNALYLINVVELSNLQINYNNTAMYAVKTPINAQMSSEPSCTVLVKGKLINQYDATGTVVSNSWSNNPADVALDLILNPRNNYAFDTSRIDWPMFSEWREFCEANSLAFNGVFDNDTNLWDALQTVARIGRASILFRGTKWSLTIERPDVVSMLFTQDNMVKDTFSVTWMGRKDRANYYEFQYYDATDKYKQHSVFIEDKDRIKFNDPMVKSTINLVGCTDAIQALNEAYLQMALNKYIVVSCQFDVFLEALSVDIGDVIAVQHSMPEWGVSGIVKSSNWVAGSSNFAFTIDQPVPTSLAVEGTQWKVLAIQSAVFVASGTVDIIGGTNSVEIQVINLTNPAAPAGEDWMHDIEKVENYASTITDGVDRVWCNGHDYRVVDSTFVPGTNTIVLMLDSSFNESLGSTVEMFRVDTACSGTVTLGTIDTATNTQTITLVGWDNITGSIQNGDRILLGPDKKVGKTFRVTDISVNDEITCTIKGQEYNESVYSATPTYTSSSSLLTTTSLQVTSLAGQQISTVLQGGAMQYSAQFIWVPPVNPPVTWAGADIYLMRNSSSFTLYQTNNTSNSVQFDNLSVGDVIRVKVVGKGTDGSQASYETAPIATITIAADGSQPEDPTTFTATGGVLQITLGWTMANDDSVSHYELQAANSNDQTTATTIYMGNVSSYTETGLSVDDTRYYWVRSVSITGTYGDWVGPVSAETSSVLTTDLEKSIQDTAKYAQSLLHSLTTPIIVAGIPGTTKGVPDTYEVGQYITNSLDGRMYVKNANGTWSPVIMAITDENGQLNSNQIGEIKAASIVGELTSNQIESLDATKVSGQLTNEQIASIDAAKINGSLTSEQIGNINIAELGGQLSSEQLGNIELAELGGGLSDAQQKSIDLAKLGGKITASQITTGAVTADAIASDSITSNKIAANTITSENMAAGAITAESLAIGSPSNIIGNSTFALTVNPWTVENINATNIIFDSCSNKGITCPSVGAMYIYAENTSTTDASIVDAYCSDLLQVSADKKVAAQVLTLTNQTSEMYVEFYNSSMNGISDSYSIPSSTTTGNTADITAYQKITLLLTPPSNAAFARLVLRLQLPASGKGWSTFTKAAICNVGINVTTVPDWVAGGVVEINGGQITSSSISTNQIAAGAIQTKQLATDAVTANTIAANAITSDKISAGAVDTAALAADAVTAEKISAGAVTAQSLAAGAVTTESLTVGTTNNLIGNSCLDSEGAGTKGWSIDGNASGIAVNSLDDTNYFYLPLYGSGQMTVTRATSGQTVMAIYKGTSGNGLPVIAGRNYLFGWSVLSSMLSSSQAVPFFSHEWLDASNNVISYVAQDFTMPAVVSSGKSQANWTRYTANATAPTNAVAVIFRAGIRFSASIGSALFYFTQTQIALLAPGATTIPDYVIGGTTTIDASSLKTGSISAGKLAANSVIAGNIAANAVTAGTISAGAVTADSLAVNSVTAGKIATDAIVAGNIQAGAIGANQIAANSINASKMASEEIISQSAQIGDLVVGTIHMQNNSITNFSTAEWTSTINITRTKETAGTYTVTLDEARNGIAIVTASFNSKYINDNYVQFALVMNGGNAAAWEWSSDSGGNSASWAYPISLDKGDNAISVTVWGAANRWCHLTNCSVTVFSRAK